MSSLLPTVPVLPPLHRSATASSEPPTSLHSQPQPVATRQASVSDTKYDGATFLDTARRLSVLQTVEQRMVDILSQGADRIARAPDRRSLEDTLTWARAGLKIHETIAAKLETACQQLHSALLANQARGLSTGALESDLAQLEALARPAAQKAAQARQHFTQTVTPAYELRRAQFAAPLSPTISVVSVEPSDAVAQSGHADANTPLQLRPLLAAAHASLQLIRQHANTTLSLGIATESAQTLREAQALYDQATGTNAAVIEEAENLRQIRANVERTLRELRGDIGALAPQQQAEAKRQHEQTAAMVHQQINLLLDQQQAELARSLDALAIASGNCAVLRSRDL
jgi:hypothetical protein